MLDIERARLHTHMLMKDLTEFMLGQPHAHLLCVSTAVKEIGRVCLTKHLEERETTPLEREHGLDLAMMGFKNQLKGREHRWFDDTYLSSFVDQFSAIYDNAIVHQQELTTHQDACAQPNRPRPQKSTP